MASLLQKYTRRGASSADGHGNIDAAGKAEVRALEIKVRSMALALPVSPMLEAHTVV